MSFTLNVRLVVSLESFDYQFYVCRHVDLIDSLLLCVSEHGESVRW